MALRVLIAVLVLAAVGDAFAEDWLLGPGVSRHVHQHGQNEVHPGFGIERHYSPTWRGILDARKNSSGDLSIYAVAAYLPWSYGAARWGVAGGLATGYAGKKDGERRENEHALRPLPLGAFAVTLEGKSVGVNVLLIPGQLHFLQVKFPLR